MIPDMHDLVKDVNLKYYQVEHPKALNSDWVLSCDFKFASEETLLKFLNEGGHIGIVDLNTEDIVNRATGEVLNVRFENGKELPRGDS